MASVNKAILTGRITRDPDLRKTQSGQSVISFTLAVDRMPAKDGTEGADFPSITAWGKTAEILNQYARKGSKIAVVGRIQTRNYDDKDGRKVYVTEVVADQIELLDSRKKDTEPADSFMPSGSGDSFYTKDLTGDTISSGEDDLPF